MKTLPLLTETPLEGRCGIHKTTDNRDTVLACDLLNKKTLLDLKSIARGYLMTKQDRTARARTESAQVAVLAIITGACVAAAGVSWWGSAGATQCGVLSIISLFSVIILGGAWRRRMWWRRAP